MTRPANVVRIEAVRYFWPEWYVRLTEVGGRVWHSNPWKSRTAADLCIRVKYERLVASGRIDSTCEAPPPRAETTDTMDAWRHE